MYGQDPTKKPTTPAAPDDNRQVTLDEWDDEVAKHYGVPRSLMKAMAAQESGGDVNAVSPTGVKGRYQVTKATAGQYGLDRDDPWQQSVAAARYLRDQYSSLADVKDEDERWLGAVGRYYGGPGAVSGTGGVSGASVDGVSNPAEHIGRVAQKWGQLRKQESGIAQPSPTPAAPAPSPTPQMNFDLSGGLKGTPAQTAINTLPKGKTSLNRVGPRLTQSERNEGLLTLPKTVEQATAPMVRNQANREIAINAVTPQARKERAELERQRKAYYSQPLVKQLGQEMYGAIARTGESAQRAANLAIRPALNALGMGDAVEQGRQVQEATGQNLAKQEEVANSLRSKVVRGLTQGAAGATILAPVAMTAGIPGVMGAVGLQQDWEKDPTGSALNTLTAGIPIKAGQMISPFAQRMAGQVASPALSKAAQLGIEGVAGAGANVAQYAGTQAALGRDINADDLAEQAITGGVLSSVMSPKLRPNPLARPEVLAQRAINRGPAIAEEQRLQGLAPKVQDYMREFSALGERPADEMQALSYDIQQAQLRDKYGINAGDLTAMQNVRQVPSVAQRQGTPVQDRLAGRTTTPTEPLQPTPEQRFADYQRNQQPTESLQGPQVTAPDVLRQNANEAKLNAAQAESEGRFDDAKNQWTAAHRILMELRRQQVKGQRGQALTPEAADTLSALDTEISIAAGNKGRRIPAQRRVATNQPELAPITPEVQQTQRIPDGDQTAIENAPTSDLLPGQPRITREQGDLTIPRVTQEPPPVDAGNFKSQTPNFPEQRISGNLKPETSNSQLSKPAPPPLAQETPAPLAKRGRVVNVNDKQYELTPEQDARWKTEVDEKTAYAKRYAEQWKQSDPQKYQKELKGRMMEIAAVKRDIVGAYTAKEKAAQAKRQASNYQGKPVSVDINGERFNGKVQGMAFGRAKVELEDGRTVNVEPGRIGEPIAQAPRQPSSRLPEPPAISQEPTNRITSGAGDELPRRVSTPLEGQPIEQPTRYTEYEGGELQRYSKPLEGQPIENILPETAKAATSPAIEDVRATRAAEIQSRQMERRTAERDAALKGPYGKFAEQARKTDADRTRPALAEHPELRELLDLPDMPPYKTESGGVNPEWNRAAQDTLNALAERGNVPRSSELDPQTLRGVYRRVQIAAQRKGKAISDSLKAAFRDTVENTTTAHENWQRFATDPRIDNVLRTIENAADAKRQLTKAETAAFKTTATAVGKEYGLAKTFVEAWIKQAPDTAIRRAGARGDQERARLSEGSAARVDEGVVPVEERATGTLGKAAPIREQAATPAPVEAKTAPPSAPEATRPRAVKGDEPSISGVEGKKAEPAATEKTAPRVSPNDLSLDLATRAHNGTSWTPERRGESEQKEYVRHMEAVWADLTKRAANDTEQGIAASEFERYRKNWLERYGSLLGSRSNLVSSFIAGPSKFPAARMNKRNDAYQKKVGEFLEWDKRAQNAMRENVRPTEPRAVSSDREDAVEVLQKKVADAERMQDAMRKANAVVRSTKLSDPEKVAKMVELGLRESTAEKALKPDFAGRKGFPDYALKNNNAEIRRLKSRVEEITANRARKPGSAEFEGGRIEENADNNRIQVFFDQKPPENVRTELKANGFRWAPSEGAWQRQRNENGRSAVERLFKVKLQAEEAAPIAPVEDAIEFKPLGDDTAQKPAELAAAPPKSATPAPPPEVVKEAAQRVETYHLGDRAEYTGKTEEVSGKTFHEIEIMEGSRKGKTALTRTTPEGENPRIEEQRQEYRQQQEEFGRLNKKPAEKATPKPEIEVQSANEETKPATAESGGRSLLEPSDASVKAARGEQTSVKIPRTDKEHTARYEVRELGDIQPSHDPHTFQKNPKYNLVNDRDYTAVSNRVDVEEATKKGQFDPRLVLTDDPTATNGPPIILESGDVLGGNSRTMMMGRVYKNHPEDAQRYKGALKKRAGMFGIDPAELDGFKEPVLVRVVEGTPENAQKMITDLNVQPGKALSSTEAASARAKQLPKETMQFLADHLAAEGADGTLAQALEGGKGLRVLNRLIDDDVIPKGERNRYLSDQGSLTATAKAEIEQMLLGRMFRDADQMKATPPEMRNKLVRIAPHLAKTAGTEWDISTLLPNAIEAAAASKNQKIDVEMLNNRGFLFGEGAKYTPEELAIAGLLKDSGPRQVENAFRRYGAEFESAQQGRGLFGDPPSQKEAFAEAFQAGEQPKQSLFDVPQDAPDLIKNASQRLKDASSGKLAGSGGQQIFDFVLVQGYHSYKAGMKFAEWAGGMVERLGDKARPYLRAVWERLEQTATGDVEYIPIRARHEKAWGEELERVGIGAPLKRNTQQARFNEEKGAVLPIGQKAANRLQPEDFVSSAIKQMSDAEIAKRLIADGIPISENVSRERLEQIANRRVKADIAKSEAKVYKEPTWVRDARHRLHQSSSGNRAGSGGQQLADIAIVTGWKTYKAGMEFADWAKDVIAKAGEKIRPHLNDTWEQLTALNDWRNGSKNVGAFLLSRLPAKAKASDALVLIKSNEKGNSAATNAGIKQDDIVWSQVESFAEKNPDATISRLVKAINDNAPRLSVKTVGSVSKDLGATTMLSTDSLRMPGPSSNYREKLVKWDNPPAGVEFKKREHYGDEKNILFDTRLEDRKTSKGEKGLFPLEFQSDWQQATDAPAAPLKSSWENRAVDFILNEARTGDYDGIMLPRTADQVAQIQRWGNLKERDGKYYTPQGYDVTTVVKRYIKDTPKLFEKATGNKLETRTIDTGRGDTEEVSWLPMERKQGAIGRFLADETGSAPHDLGLGKLFNKKQPQPAKPTESPEDALRRAWGMPVPKRAAVTGSKGQGGSGKPKAPPSLAPGAPTGRDIKWHDYMRSPLSNLNYKGTYERAMGEQGKDVSEAFRKAQISITKDQESRADVLKDLRQQMKPVQKQLRDEGRRGLANWIDSHIEGLHDPNDAFKGLAGFLKGFHYNTKLRFNPRSAAVNLMQPFQTLWPHMTTGDFLSVTRQAGSASERARVKAAIGEELGTKVEDSGKKRNWDLFTPASNFNRTVGYLAGEKMADQMGVTGAAKARMAMDWMKKVEFDNSRWDVPPLFRGKVASVVGQFKGYTVKNIERIMADVKSTPHEQLATNSWKGAGTIARRAKMITSQVAIGGVRSAIPGLKHVAGILTLAGLSAAFSKTGMDEDKANKAAEMVYFGAPALVEADLSGSVSVLDEPFGDTPAEKMVNFLGGPTLSLIAKAWKEAPTITDTSDTDKQKAAALRLAKAVSPYFKTAETVKDLATGQKPTIKMGKEEKEMTPLEIGGKLLMGTPVRQTKYYQDQDAYDWQKNLLGMPVKAKGKPGKTGRRTVR